VGDLYGMLHAIDTSSGEEQWAYIPSNLLSKLKNDRTNPNAVNDFAAVDASPTVRDVFFDPDYDPEADPPVAENPSWRTILVCPQGFGGKSVFALDVTNPAPDSWKVLWEATDILEPGGGMGHAFRASLDKVLVSETNQLTGKTSYSIEWIVYVATSYADIAEEHGGIHIYAFDLKTGQQKWTAFSSEYTDSVNDIPGAVTTYDIDGDSFADRVYVGDMNGRLWELNAVGLTNPHGTSDDEGHQIPLFNAGVGNPISVSPAITRRNGQVILVFGTGGTHWATVSDDKLYHVYAVSASAANSLPPAQKNDNYESFGGAIGAMWSLPLEPGEKVWSSPTIAASTIFIATAGGTLESGNPRSDVDGGGRLIGLGLDKKAIWDAPIAIGKVRGSLFVSNQHVYLTTIDNTIIQVGGDKWATGFGDRVVLKSWRQF
jgi:type IV pilus assembly protein PilY1